MTIRRFYIPPARLQFGGPEQIQQNEIPMSNKVSHQMRDVLRLKKGDEIIVFDGAGREYLCDIKRCAREGVILEIKRRLEKAKDVDKLCAITLAQALPKKAKMDYIIEKATELGARAIIPMMSERTIVRLGPSNAQKKAERWQE